MRVSTNRKGAFETTASGDLSAPEWELDMPAAKRSEAVMAYFIASELALGKGLPTLDSATLEVLDSLSQCNHLAGEISGNAARDAELQMKLDEASCEALPTAYATALAKADEGSSLHEYLRRNSPNWM